MWIGEAADQAGVNVQTLRYYERRGLVRFIKRAQDLGFSLDKIKKLLRFRKNGGRSRQRIRGVAEQRIHQIEQKIAELERMRGALRTLVHSCHKGDTLECPIIEALETDGRR